MPARPFSVLCFVSATLLGGCAVDAQGDPADPAAASDPQALSASDAPDTVRSSLELREIVLDRGVALDQTEDDDKVLRLPASYVNKSARFGNPATTWESHLGERCVVGAAASKGAKTVVLRAGASYVRCGECGGAGQVVCPK